MSWQPPEDAPRDGTRIIGWYGDRPIIVWWRLGPDNNAGGKVWYWSSGYFRHPEPDCWQPCPEPPLGVASLVYEPPKQLRKSYPKAIPLHEPINIERKLKLHRLLIQGNLWCSQCDKRVTGHQAVGCTSPFCKAKLLVAS